VTYTSVKGRNSADIRRNRFGRFARELNGGVIGDGRVFGPTDIGQVTRSSAPKQIVKGWCCIREIIVYPIAFVEKAGSRNASGFRTRIASPKTIGSRRAKKDSRRDELDRANDVVIKLLELIGRYPLLAMRRKYQPVCIGYFAKNDESTRERRT
jgi:hypothetical protein